MLAVKKTLKNTKTALYLVRPNIKRLLTVSDTIVDHK